MQLCQFYTFIKMLWSYTSLWPFVDDKVTLFDLKGVTIGWAIPISRKRRPESYHPCSQEIQALLNTL